jgi:hypothetical protein
MEKAHSAIQMCLNNEVLCEVEEEKTVAKLWLKLESLHVHDQITHKSLGIQL